MEKYAGGDATDHDLFVGDMGLIASRQSILYQEQYGWNRGIEVHEGDVTTIF